MRDKFTNKVMSWIMSNYPSMQQDRYDELRYGVDVLYLGLSKYALIFAVAFILGCFKEALLCGLLFGIIRGTSFGLHSNSSISCLIVSSVVILGIPYLSKAVYLMQWQKALICAVLIAVFAKYAPADTKKHPLVNQRIRFYLKSAAIATAVIYSATVIFTDNYISNMILFSMMTESIIILPVTYRIFNESYDNYLKYANCKGETI